MVDYIKEIKQALNDLHFKPVYSGKAISEDLVIKNGEEESKRTYEVYFADKLVLKVSNIFTSDKDRGYAARYIYNNLMCEGLL